MNRLGRRVAALEGPSNALYEHMTDEEITHRLVEIYEELEAQGLKSNFDWRELVAREDWSALTNPNRPLFDKERLLQ